MVQILIISDGKVDDGVVRLGEVSYDIYGEQNIESACDTILRFPPDIILIQLKKANVEELTGIYKRIRAVRDSKKIPIISFANEMEAELLKYDIRPKDRRFVALPLQAGRQAVFGKINEMVGVAHDDARKPILYVDTDEKSLEQVMVYLAKKYNVHTCNQPDLCVELAEDIKPAAILLAVNEDFDGRNVMNVLKTRVGVRNIPVIFICGITTAEVVSSCISMKSAGVVIAPIKKDDILYALEKTVENKKRKKVLYIDDDSVMKSRMEQAFHDEAKLTIADSKTTMGNLLSKTVYDVVILNIDNMKYCYEILKGKVDPMTTKVFLMSREHKRELVPDENAENTFLIRSHSNANKISNQILEFLGE